MASRQADPGPGLAFIVAAPRSGTTWLQTALNAHPQICCTELRLFGEHFDVVLDDGQDRPRLRCTLDRYVRALVEPMPLEPLALGPKDARGVLTDLLARTLAGFVRTTCGKSLVIDKVTPYEGTSAHVVRSIERTFPGARIVRLVRDPRDVVVSGVHHWLTKRLAGAEADAFERRRRAALVGGEPIVLERLCSDDEIRSWTRQWVEPIRALRGRPGTIELRYERMIAGLTGELGRLCAHLGADTGASVLEGCARAASFEAMSGGRRAGQGVPGAHVRRGVAGDWRRWLTRRDAEIIDGLAGSELVELGYEPDRAWIGALPESLGEPTDATART